MTRPMVLKDSSVALFPHQQQKIPSSQPLFCCTAMHSLS